jgi:HSP20 family protein
MRFRSFDPWLRFRRMQEEMNRIFRDIDRPRATAFPPVNIWANEDGLVVTAELPGVDPDGLEISALRESLSIHGERKIPETESDTTWHRHERRYGRFNRTIDLPFAIDADSVDASFRDGILRIGLRRPEEEKPRKIEVKGA